MKLYFEDYDNQLIERAGLSRIKQLIENKASFAIIGSRDSGIDILNSIKEDKIIPSNKDGEDYRKQIESDLGNNLVKKHRDANGYRKLRGKYTYQTGPRKGEIDREISFMIMNCTFSFALELARKYNQESFIWKDYTTFSMISSISGYEDGKFEKCFDVDYEDESPFSSSISNINGTTPNKNRNTPFVFKAKEN